MPPFSRASFLEDIFANLLYYVAICNNDQWTHIDYGPELRDQDGSENVFNGRLLPYMGFSDHEFFNSGSVGIPAVMLIDLPFIAHHTHKDDLNLLDPTQLKRVSFLSAAAAYTIAAAGPREAPAIVDEIYYRGRMRLETEIKLAMTLLREATKDNAAEMFRSADNLIVHGFKREIRALRSAELFIKGSREEAAYLSKKIDKLASFEKESRRDLSEYYRRTCGILGIQAMMPKPTNEELILKTIVPKPNPRLIGTLGTLNEYPVDKYMFPAFDSMGTFSYELLNLMDGKRNLFEILQEVRAEALSSNFQGFPVKDILEFVGALKASTIISY